MKSNLPARKHRVWGLQPATCNPNLTARTRSPNGFTLVEVVLAIGIAIGLLVVALYFYQQSANLRTQLIEESERLATIRLLLDRISTDLRTAYAQPQQGFTGDSTSMRFVRSEVLSRAGWIPPLPGRNLTPETDLKLVAYGVTSALEGTNLVTSGIFRSEQPLIEKPHPPGQILGQTNTGSVFQTNAQVAPLTEAIHYLRARYCGGGEWADTWDSTDPPKGVEISLGIEPLPEGTDPADYPYEIFRRIIYLPGGSEGDLP